ncbi:MAG: T9SS type A sorting domain-containing protein [Ignavibacteriae bacterium]|nr:T9SS C-terminal target domain-containing protein [Ignavibacteriota bacterium]NOG98075.1 T9SS type A sorting domain-containing protein [Ignavibacteriota bacterium]
MTEMTFKNIYSLAAFFILAFILSSKNQAQTLDEKIGQMIMVGYSTNNGFEDTLFYDIQNRNLGGVVLFAYNIDSPVQIAALTEQLKSYASTPLLIATDQEGGIVARLDENNGYIKTHSAYKLGTVFNIEDSTRAQASLMASWLNDAGINTNLAPVVDVDVNPLSPAIGRWGRSFSSDPMTVYQHSAWTIDEYENANILTALKHFPGHGSAETDTHLGFTDVTATWADSELIPYQELFADGYSGMVMTAHIFNSNWDENHPASLSANVLNGLLRDTLGFSGVIISDELFMPAVSQNYSFEESVILTIKAGTDILLFSTNERNGSSLVAEVIDLVKQKITDGEISINSIDESYQRIAALKSTLTGIKENNDELIPNTFSMQAYPNPFNISTNIVINLNEANPVEVKIFDVTGRLIYKKKYATMKSGRNVVRFNADNLSSGMYIVRIDIPGKFTTGKIILLK